MAVREKRFCPFLSSFVLTIFREEEPSLVQGWQTPWKDLQLTITDTNLLVQCLLWSIWWRWHSSVEPLHFPLYRSDGRRRKVSYGFQFDLSTLYHSWYHLLTYVPAPPPLHFSLPPLHFSLPLLSPTPPLLSPTPLTPPTPTPLSHPPPLPSSSHPSLPHPHPFPPHSHPSPSYPPTPLSPTPLPWPPKHLTH